MVKKMTLEEMIRRQMYFDSLHTSEKFDWDEQITIENIEVLEFLLLSLVGEVGEAANLVKKIVRGDFSLEEKKSEISEELTDIFIYLLKISYQLNINLEEEYSKKMNKNMERFKNYERIK